MLVMNSASARVEVIVSNAKRLSTSALHTCVALDLCVPREGRTWRPVCSYCLDALDIAVEIESHRVNTNTGHDTGSCSFCGYSGRETLVASVENSVYADPPASFLECRREYEDFGGALAIITSKYK